MPSLRSINESRDATSIQSFDLDLAGEGARLIGLAARAFTVLQDERWGR
jgi:hypothetical protein